ncbi:MAG: ABC transporter ATP-binding protein [Clostridia bacterium]|nr:ABC transporter ATP-binding protein [Clostridia bacterium]
MSDISIKVDDLTKVYRLYSKPIDRLKESLSLTKKCYHREHYALKNVNFEIKKGETVGIIGVNGAGKSTILKIITGVLNPTEGNVTVNGKISALLELGAGFNPEYTGIENIYLNGTMMGFTRDEVKQRMDSILEFADIGDFVNQPVKTYSSGMFVRLAFAVAINVEPDVLIIDEALSVGDVFFQQKCYKKIKELTGKSTVLIVSHDLNAMTKFCKRIIVMADGKNVFDGEPNEAIAKYFKIKQGAMRGESKNERIDTSDFREYKVPDAKDYSGKMNVVIEKYFYSVEGEGFSENCGKNDEFKVSMVINSNMDIESPIIGYQIRDKYGNEVFGQTSLTSNVEQFEIREGRNIINFSFDWPEIREGDYFITLGIGNGTEVLNQVEECWINNAIHVTATTHGKTIFGVFNNDMKEFEINKID